MSACRSVKESADIVGESVKKGEGIGTHKGYVSQKEQGET